MLAEILLEIANTDLDRSSVRRTNESMVYNISNPEMTSWSDLVPVMLRYMPQGTKTLPISDWVDALKQAAAELPSANVHLPAIKLIDFYEGLCGKDEVRVIGKMKIQNSLLSISMQRQGPIRSDWLARWLENWDLPGIS